jgi:hypothetical protein
LHTFLLKQKLNGALPFQVIWGNQPFDWLRIALGFPP